MRFWLLTYGRTASNLLMRILNLGEQPSIQCGTKTAYFFVPTLYWRVGKRALAERPLPEWSEEEIDGIWQAYRESFEDLLKHAYEAEAAGKNVFVKEHAAWMLEPTAETKYKFGEASTNEAPWTIPYESSIERTPLNDTVLCDDFLKTWRPTFLIRHPALSFPSRYRTTLLPGSLTTDRTVVFEMAALHWSRRLYDWYANFFTSNPTGDVWPIVLDADDIITSPEVIARFCEIIGLDFTKCKFTWNAATTEDYEKMGEFSKRMGKSLNASSGILEGKTSDGLDLQAEVEKWTAEFGEEMSCKLKAWVEDALPDYEYLRSKRLLANP